MVAPVTAKAAVEALIEHWRTFGLPGYAQFDNDTIFQGTHTHPDVIGRVMRLCLSLGIVPVFVPPREMGFQAMIESYNGQWQAKVWARFAHGSLAELEGRSGRYVAAVHRAPSGPDRGGPAATPLPGAMATKQTCRIDLTSPGFSRRGGPKIQPVFRKIKSSMSNYFCEVA